MPKKKKQIPKGYDSRWEWELHTTELKKLNYHSEVIPYVVPATYEADFSYQTNGTEVLVEAKGRFRTRKEATKYIHVREAINQESSSKEAATEKELIFLFQDSYKPMPGAQKRADGTKQTHGEWAKKNGFRYICYKRDGVPKWLMHCNKPPQSNRSSS